MADEELIQIRRYPNRRLYDRSRAQYVTLGDIEELVRNGHTVEVRDSKTEEDLTRQILTQILLERHPDKIAMFPVAMLHNMLRANGLAMELLSNYMKQSLSLFESLPKSVPPLTSPLNWFSAFFPGSAPTGGMEEASSTSEMGRRLAELETRINDLEATANGTAAENDPKSVADAAVIERLDQRIHDLEHRASRSTEPPSRRSVRPEKGLK